MSHGTVVVRFPSGQLLYGSYSGTSDIVTPALYRHPVVYQDCVIWSWVDAERFGDNWGSADPEEVDIATDYGGGMHWRGIATLRYTQLLRGIEPYGAEDSDGTVIEESCHPKHGLPEWWPAQVLEDYWNSKKETKS